MATNPTDQFSQPPLPFIQQHPNRLPLRSGSAADPKRVQNGNKSAQVEPFGEAVEEESRRRLANGPRQQQPGWVPTMLDPNASRGLIIDIEV